MLTRRRLLVALGAAGACALAAACDRSGATTLRRIRESGVARVAIAGEQPYGFSDAAGRVTGEGPEVARLVLRAVGVDGIEAVQVPFDKLIDTLVAGDADLVTAGLTISPERCARVAFSRPDFVVRPAFLVRRGNPAGLRSFADVVRTRVRLGVLAGSAEQAWARASGVPDHAVTTYDGQSSLVAAVADQHVDAGALTRISLLDALRRNPGLRLEVTPGFRVTIAGREVVPAGGFAFRREDADLVAAFDDALAAAQASGDWLRVASPFGFTAANLPPADVTTAALCAGAV
ncbi:ABC-type transporter, periplasmic subunit family 3 [Pseudonocardia dioxanivorans CB1190]|uniref:ABC-type transporter, periplasmic subunit family 3 n=1 Tax=Pseudonocardia dioxanivorans (strain ATCC 55486 / DSM 44775 / JCM 13855 / CB1190) TaxID=675635 RepID=F4CJ82_PSEUX|nr:transporter substrate-binding domain-containing protein [Pseudonocardia dioxanivorans]AEA23932.1 ABC-type transporter, periplasmic subunit family 3 [Pseudonocardia dioxanivorans CB1190]GJF05132.1 ectoine/hydroxyectoine ABC transporter substrate-binding protein EhuB [Pseudonocardia sp. D17]